MSVVEPIMVLYGFLVFRLQIARNPFAFFHHSVCEYATTMQQSSETGKRKVQGMPQSQAAALPRHQEEKETDKTKQAQIEQMCEKL